VRLPLFRMADVAGPHYLEPGVVLLLGFNQLSFSHPFGQALVVLQTLHLGIDVEIFTLLFGVRWEDPIGGYVHQRFVVSGSHSQEVG